jgi:hypothetical protein
MRRLAGLLLAVGWVSGQFLGDLHLALAPHRICAQHGEWVEGEDGAGAPRPRDALDGIETHFDASDDAMGAREHEHCLTWALSQQRSLTGSRLALPSWRSTGWVVALWAPGANHPPVAALRLAPKHSPPIA